MMEEEDIVHLRPRDQVALPDDPELQNQLCSELARFVSPRRLERLEASLAHRTRWLTVGLEDVFQSHNASAVLRSCDCFGVQDVHVIDERNEFTIHRAIALGAAQWLDVYRHRGADSDEAVSRCCHALKDRGYRVVATTPHDGAIDLDDVDVSRTPMALLFGTELTGLSDAAMDHVDEAIRIPIFGFTESLNVSVSAALILRHLTTALRARDDEDYGLSSTELVAVRLAWLRRSMRHGEAIIRRYLADHNIETLPASSDSLQKIEPDVDAEGEFL